MLMVGFNVFHGYFMMMLEDNLTHIYENFRINTNYAYNSYFSYVASIFLHKVIKIFSFFLEKQVYIPREFHTRQMLPQMKNIFKFNSNM